MNGTYRRMQCGFCWTHRSAKRHPSTWACRRARSGFTRLRTRRSRQVTWVPLIIPLPLLSKLCYNTPMKHPHHCHCGFAEKSKKFKAGKLGWLGGVFVVLHLLYHVAECIILPAVLIALHSNQTEATELSPAEVQTATFSSQDYQELQLLRTNFYDSLQKYALRP